MNYFITRVRANLQIMEQIDLVGRTSEFARVFGIEFYHVLSRGSQVGTLTLCSFSYGHVSNCNHLASDIRNFSKSLLL